MILRVALVSGPPALLPVHRSLIDPVAELRRAALSATRWLGSSTELFASDESERVGSWLLDATRRTRHTLDGRSVLVVANGSAKRSLGAPGHFDPHAELFDSRIGNDLTQGNVVVPARAACAAMWADLDGLRMLAARVRHVGQAVVDYDAAPHGVQYWVMRWEVGCDLAKGEQDV